MSVMVVNLLFTAGMYRDGVWVEVIDTTPSGIFASSESSTLVEESDGFDLVSFARGWLAARSLADKTTWMMKCEPRWLSLGDSMDGSQGTALGAFLLTVEISW